MMTRVYQERVLDRQGNVLEVRDWTPEEIAAHVALERATMPPLSRRQTFLMLAKENLLSRQEAKEGAAGNSIPASIVAVFDAQEAAGAISADERLDYELTFLSFQQAERLSPLVPLLVQAAPDPSAITDAVLDALWAQYAQS